MEIVVSEDQSFSPVLELAAQIVSAYVANNEFAAEGLPALIRDVYSALETAGRAVPEPEKLQPAVPVKRPVFPDYTVCLEDGKTLKMLKRHLQIAYGMPPDEYRERSHPPADYPMLAPIYA